VGQAEKKSNSKITNQISKRKETSHEETNKNQPGALRFTIFELRFASWNFGLTAACGCGRWQCHLAVFLCGNWGSRLG